MTEKGAVWKPKKITKNKDEKVDKMYTEITTAEKQKAKKKAKIVKKSVDLHVEEIAVKLE